MERDSGSSVRYSHDAAGNIVGVEVVETNGMVRRQNVTVGSANSVQRVDYVGSHAISIEYDKRGRPVGLDIDRDVVSVEYRADGRLARMSSTAIEKAWTPEHGYAVLRRERPDARLAVLSVGPADQNRRAVCANTLASAGPATQGSEVFGRSRPRRKK